MLNNLNRILILDSPNKITKELKSILIRYGANATLYHDIVSAKNILESDQYDIFLVNIDMPEIDISLLNTMVSSIKEQNDVFVALLTEQINSTTFSLYKDIANDIITLPIESELLLIRIKNLIQIKESKEELKSINFSLERLVIEKTEQLNAANHKLKNINQELIELDEAKNDFLNIISHEIRTPLNGIFGSLHLMKDVAESQEIQELINNLDSSIERLENFSMKAILTAQLKTNKYKLQKSKINISRFFQFIIFEFSDKIQEKQINVKIDVQDNINDFPADYDLVAKAIGFLFENALEYSNIGKDIELQAYQNEQETYLCIKDFGPGFKENVLNAPFQQLKLNGQQQDNKLSMSFFLIHQIMLAHDSLFEISNHDDGALATLKFITS